MVRSHCMWHESWYSVSFDSLKTHDLMLFEGSFPVHKSAKEKALGLVCERVHVVFILIWPSSVSQSTYRSGHLSTGLTRAQSTNKEQERVQHDVPNSCCRSGCV